MKKTIIEFLADPVTGDQQALDLIHQIGREANTDPHKLQLYKFIIRGLEFLERHGIPRAISKYFVDQRDDGKPYTIKIAKDLKYHPPLMEFRINWRKVGAFRSVFFEYQYAGLQILCFVKAVIKQSTNDPAFEKIIKESEQIYFDFLRYPEKYINFEKE